MATATSFLQAGNPVLAQASRQPLASLIVAKLNGIIQREFSSSEPYFAVFSNGGAESVEVRLKHVEFGRGLKIQALRADINAHIEETPFAVVPVARCSPEDTTEISKLWSASLR